jgi:hypothetical protein
MIFLPPGKLSSGGRDNRRRWHAGGKTFERVLVELNVPVESLVAVSDMSDGKIIFAE